MQDKHQYNYGTMKIYPILTKKTELWKLLLIPSHCLTQKSVITWLELDVCTYIQFLAAKSLWTNFLLARYFIPLATWRPNPIKSFTVGFCKTQTFVIQWMQKPKEQSAFCCDSLFDAPILPLEWLKQVSACSKTGLSLVEFLPPVK